MTVPKPHGGATAPKDRDWNWSSDQPEAFDKLLDHGGWKAAAAAHAWYDDSDGDPPERKGDYKLPHHEVIGGEPKVVWHGVSHAMNILLGGRGGVNIPDGDRKAVYQHLAKHYEQFGEDPPEFH
jgi:hypothetical protein